MHSPLPSSTMSLSLAVSRSNWASDGDTSDVEDEIDVRSSPENPDDEPSHWKSRRK